MNLQKTIEQLEQQAAKYTEAANSLRALLEDGKSPANELAEAPQRNSAPRAAGKAPRKKARRVVSEETRARLAEAMRERHRKKREEREAQQAQEQE